MISHRPHSARAGRRPPALLLASAAIAAIMPLAIVAALAPPPLALPVLSLVSIAAAAIIAAAAWAFGAGRRAPGVNAWDLAGIFTLIGCAAAMLTESEYALEYLIASKNK